jgi:acetylornithine deacetylase/succinyl-diaminopimelate desuccinylase-like protein
MRVLERLDELYALGVVAAIEVAERTGAPVTVVAFRDEERGCIGSRACTARPSAYLELHIEQGPVLERAGAPLGLVTAIVGQSRGEVVFEGTAGHAGTTPMSARDDALVRAAEFVLSRCPGRRSRPCGPRCPSRSSSSPRAQGTTR